MWTERVDRTSWPDVLARRRNSHRRRFPIVYRDFIRKEILSMLSSLSIGMKKSSIEAVSVRRAYNEIEGAQNDLYCLLGLPIPLLVLQRFSVALDTCRSHVNSISSDAMEKPE